MAQLVEAPNPWPKGKYTIFLAGVIDQGKARPWQKEVADALADYDVVVLSPRRPDWDESWEQSVDNPEFVEQVSWESRGLREADFRTFVVFEDSEAPITLLEFGKHLDDPGCVMFEEGFYRDGNLEFEATAHGMPIFNSLEEMITHIKAFLDKKGLKQAEKTAGEHSCVDASYPLAATKTPAFKAWFAGSQVVNGLGEPMVVFHGTRADFDEFTKGDLGFHVGGLPQAEKRINCRDKKQNGGNPAIMPLFASIKNPLRTTDAGDWSNPFASYSTVNKALKGALGSDLIPDYMPDFYSTPTPREEKQKRLRDELIKRGYDGIVYRNRVEGVGSSWIAFSPNQLKSAIGNKGEFDPKSTSLTASAKAGCDWRNANTKSVRLADFDAEFDDFNVLVMQYVEDRFKRGVVDWEKKVPVHYMPTSRAMKGVAAWGMAGDDGDERGEPHIAELMKAMEVGTNLPPAFTDDKGVILDGRHRTHAASRLGYKQVPYIRLDEVVAKPTKASLLEPKSAATQPVVPPDPAFQPWFTGMKPEDWEDTKKAPAAKADVTSTPEFLAWFGSSKVVDTDGRPLIVFHGTASASKQFLNRGRSAFAELGFWFDAIPYNAHDYAHGESKHDQSNMMPVYLRVETPKEFHNIEELQDIANGKFGANLKLRMRKLRTDLKKEGYDGAVVRNSLSSDGAQPDFWVTFTNKQIKSAIGNSGAFDPDNHSITAAVESPVKDLTETPAFKAWFAGSKIVDSSGKPWRMYHGTDKAFDKFYAPEQTPLLFFTPDPNLAYTFADDRATDNGGYDPEYGDGGAPIMPCYIRSSKPFDPWFEKRLMKEWGLATPQHRRDGHYEVFEDTELLEKIRNLGYDSIWMYEHEDHDTLAVFSPNQVKSAIGNNGDFDPKQESITAAVEAPASGAINTPAFKAWFRKSIVKDKDGNPLLVHRGEHGEYTPGQGFQSREPSLSFGSEEAAHAYAELPNDRKDKLIHPRVFGCYLRIEKPLIVDFEDPFIDFTVIAKALGPKRAAYFAVKHEDSVYNTNNWQENFSEFDDVQTLLAKQPDAINELYMDLFPLLADAEFVTEIKAKGFDGAIHGGNGETALEAEYKVFGQDQVWKASMKQLTVTASTTKAAGINTGDSLPAVPDWNAYVAWCYEGRKNGEQSLVCSLMDLPYGWDRWKENLEDAQKKFKRRTAPLRSLKFPLNVFRAVRLKTGIKDLRLGNIGVCWSYSEYAAKPIMAQGKGVDYMLHGTADSPDAIDWAMSASWALEKPGEKEVRLKAGVPVTMVGYRRMKEDEDWTAFLGKAVTARAAEVAPPVSLVDSPTFKAWFQGSKIVDASGAPLRVLHGTTADFEEFRSNGVHFFTEDPTYTEGFSSKTEPGAKTIPVYLSIKNPLDARKLPDLISEAAWGELIDLSPKYMREEFGRNDYPFWYWFMLTRRSSREGFIKRGYDGVIQEEEGANGQGHTTAYAAFYPNQIKSAIGNNGAFDPKQESITASAMAPDEHPLSTDTHKVRKSKGFGGEEYFMIVDRKNGDAVGFADTEADIPNEMAKVNTPPAPKEKTEFETLYRGEGNTSKRNGKFWSPDPDFAVQFTQTGRPEELRKVTIKSADIYEADPLPYGGDPGAVEATIKEARAGGFRAVRCSEGQNNPDSVYMFSLAALRKAAKVPVPAKGLTDTPGFKAWFAGSKVINPDGTPMVVYHGTNKDFGEFDTEIGEMGSHFGTSSHANSVNTVRPGGWEEDYTPATDPATGAKLLPCYLSIKNPLRLQDTGTFEPEGIVGQLGDAGVLTQDEVVDLCGDRYWHAPEVKKRIIAAGYDGIIYLNRREGEGVPREDDADFDENNDHLPEDQFKTKFPSAQDSWIAFYPSQIKSAIGNNGDFDPNKGSITAAAKTAAFDRWFHGTSKWCAKFIVKSQQLNPGSGDISNYDDALAPREDAVYITDDLETAWEYADRSDDGGVVFEVKPDGRGNFVPDEDSIASALKYGNVNGDSMVAGEVRRVWLEQHEAADQDFDTVFKPYFADEVFEGEDPQWAEDIKKLADFIRTAKPRIAKDLISAYGTAAHIGPVPVLGTVDRTGILTPLRAPKTRKAKLLTKAGSPDFGYKQYTDREKDLAQLKFVDDPDGLAGAAGARSKMIAAYAPAEMYPHSQYITDNGMMVGYIDVGPWGEKGAGVWVVFDVNIEDEWRGTGLGQMLYDKGIAAAKAAGANTLTSSVDMSNDAQRAWKRLRSRYPVKSVKDPEATWGRRWYIDLGAAAPKTAYLSPKEAELTISIEDGARAKVTISLDLGIPNFTRFAINFPCDGLLSDEIDSYARQAFEALLDSLTAFMISMKYDEDRITAITQAADACFMGLGNDDASDAGLDPDRGIRMYEGHFELPIEFVEETHKRVVLAGKVQRSPEFREITLRPLATEEIDSLPEPHIQMFRDMITKTTPKPFSVQVIDKPSEERARGPKPREWESRLLQPIV